MKSNNLLTWVLGVAALGVTVYVVGRAWKASQAPKGTKVVDADEQATFVDDFDNAAGGNRLTAIAKAGGFRRADGEMATFVDDDFANLTPGQQKIKAGLQSVGNYLAKKNPNTLGRLKKP